MRALSKKILIVTLIVGISTSGLLARDKVKISETMKKGLAERDKVAEFLEKNMMGRMLTKEINSTIAKGTIYSNFKRETTFHGLERTKTGLKYVATYVIKQTLWDLDKDGKKKNQGKTKNRTMTSETQLGLNSATGALMGYRRGLTNTVIDPTGGVSVIRSFKLVNGELHIGTQGVNYGACFAKNNTYTPCTFTGEAIYSIEDGKLVEKNTYTMYDVNPKTFEKTIYKKDAVTTTVTKEI